MEVDRLEERRLGEYGHFVAPLNQLLGDVSAHLHGLDLLKYLPEVEAIQRADQGVHPEEAAVLYCLVRAMRPALVLETGTFEGYSTAQLARALQSNGQGHLETVDLAAETGQRVPEGLRTFVTFRRNMPSKSMVRILSDRNVRLDLFFHDSLHTYENTLSELISFAPFFKPGCVVICHDAKMDFKEGFGVARAVRKFVEAFGIPHVVLDTTCGLSLFRWPEDIEAEKVTNLLNDLAEHLRAVSATHRLQGRLKRLMGLFGYR